MGVTVSFSGEVAVITWDDGENRVNTDSLGALGAVLEELAGTTGPLALVLTGVGKFFSNGLDLERFGADPGEIDAALAQLHQVLSRLLTFPAYTVAALNGHTFAAGALLSCGFDYRVMRVDRGFWCMNELDIGLPLDEKLLAILAARLGRATLLEAILTARRYGGAEALSAGIVEETAEESALLERAIEVAAAMAGKDRGVLSVHKRLAFAETVRVLGHPEYL